MAKKTGVTSGRSVYLSRWECEQIETFCQDILGCSGTFADSDEDDEPFRILLHKVQGRFTTPAMQKKWSKILDGRARKAHQAIRAALR